MRSTLKGHLEGRRFEEIATMAAGSKRVLGQLVALTFDPDPETAWRAVEAMGIAAARVADDDPEYVRHHLRRLHWLLSEESGGICWRAPEAMAEIVHRRPGLFADYAPIVAHLLVEMAEEDLGHFRAGILWAIGRLGHPFLEEVAEVLPAVVEALDHPDAQVRGAAVWSLGQVRRMGELAGRDDLRRDQGEVAIYEGGVLNRATVGGLLTSLLDRGG